MNLLKFRAFLIGSIACLINQNTNTAELNQSKEQFSAQVAKTYSYKYLKYLPKNYDGKTKSYFVKRFLIETSTLSKNFSFINDSRGSKLILATLNEKPVLKFSYRTKKGEKKSRLEDLSNFVEVKGWKAIGNKLGNYLRMSGFKYIEQYTEDDLFIDNDDLNLFPN